MYNLTDGLLKEGTEVTVLALNTIKHPFNSKLVPQNYIEQTSFQTIFINTNVNPLKAFLNLFSGTPYNIERFYSTDFEKLIISVLKEKEFDIIQFESIYVLPYLNTVKKYSNAKIALRAHNIEHKLWKRRTAEERNIFKKIYFKQLTARLKEYEIDSIKKVDAIVAITQDDEAWFKAAEPGISTITIPFGIDINRYNDTDDLGLTPTVFFIGALDWKPNIDGLLWFIENVWKKTNDQTREIKMYIAGKNTPKKIKELASNNLIVEGEVPDALRFMGRHKIMVAPLFSGGGMRVKIIEGMALGKTIITTSIGAEGIPCTNEENILIGNSAEDLSKHLIKCINDQNFCNVIGNNAGIFAHKNYDNRRFSKELIGFYDILIA